MHEPVPALAYLSPPPELQQLALNFLATFFLFLVVVPVVVAFALNFMATFLTTFFSDHLVLCSCDLLLIGHRAHTLVAFGLNLSVCQTVISRQKGYCSP